MFKPVPLNLPPYLARLSTDGEQYFIYDELRKKHLVCTPEEWVRQHWIQHLIREKGYPKGLIKPEGGLSLHGMPRRSDLVIFNTSGRMILLAEFKSPAIRMGPEVFDQISRYNSVYRIPLLLASNGLEHYCWEIDWETNSYRFLDDLPDYRPD